MSVLYIVMPVAFLLAAVAVMGFIWAAREGQFDDLDTPSFRVVTEDDGGARRNGVVAPAMPSDQTRRLSKASKQTNMSGTSTVESR